MTDALRVAYRIETTADLAAARAEAIALEQSVEMPRDCVPSWVADRGVVGEVESVLHLRNDESAFCAWIRYPLENTGWEATQILNVLFGNTSLHPDVSVLDVHFPHALLDAFRGPALGMAGIRTLVNAPTRPLTATALKPMGLNAQGLGQLCELFARAGIDLIKDDHGIANQPYAPFDVRVGACQAAIARARDMIGCTSLYVPNVSGSPASMRRRIDLALELGVRAVMVAPMLVGLPAFEELTNQYPEMVFLGHPALGGAVRFAPECLFGRLFRLFGAGAVIFVNYGGRFGYSEVQCSRMADNLRGEWAHIAPAFPVPAGGMTVDRVAELVEFYGRDTILLISGGLYTAGSEIEARSREFVQEVARCGGV